MALATCYSCFFRRFVKCGLRLSCWLSIMEEKTTAWWQSATTASFVLLMNGGTHVQGFRRAGPGRLSADQQLRAHRRPFHQHSAGGHLLAPAGRDRGQPEPDHAPLHIDALR